MKANSIISTKVTELPDGNFEIEYDVKGAGVVVLHTAKVSDANMQYAAIHGLKQRVSDAAALSRNTETGASASAADKLASMREVVDHLETGTDQWRMIQTGEGGGKSITIEAIALIKNIPYETAVDYVERYAAKVFGNDTKKCLAYLRKGAQIQEKIAEIRKSRESKPVIDADKALNELENV